MNKKIKKLYRHLVNVVKQEVLEEIQNEILNKDDTYLNQNSPMTAKEICEYYKIHPSTLERYVREGLSYQSQGKNYKRTFTKENYQKFINRKK